MAIPKHVHAIVLLIFLIFISYGCEEIGAMRMLNGEQWMKRNLVIQSLPRGPVPPSQSNPCTYIPGGASRGRCTLARDFSSRVAVVAAPPAFPPMMVQFGAVYRTSDENSKQDSS